MTTKSTASCQASKELDPVEYFETLCLQQLVLELLQKFTYMEMRDISFYLGEIFDWYKNTPICRKETLKLQLLIYSNMALISNV